MTTTEKLKDWFARRAVRLSDKHAQEVISMITKGIEDETRTVIMSKFSTMNNRYETMRTLKVHYDVVLYVLQVKHKTDVLNFYRYEIFDKDGHSTGFIFSMNPCLFD